MSFVDKLKLHLYIKKLERKKIYRDKNIIMSWNNDVWNQTYDEIDFESLTGIIKKNPNSFSLFVKNNKIFKGKWIDYVESYENQLTEVILDNANDDPIVELGCGLGRHLFQLYKKNLRKLEGYDISKNAIFLAQKHSDKKNYGIKFDILDITETIKNDILKNKIIFTHGCLEQLKHFMPNVLTNILNNKPKLVINFEVDYESSSSLVKKYFNARDYQNNLVTELNKLQNENKIIIRSVKQLPLSLSPVNRLSTIIWQPL